jgi:cell division protein ZapA (FtsZ GTPase activity inhibitor)
MINDKTTVRIKGIEYSIETELEPLELNAITKFVEEKLDENSLDPNAQITSYKTAIMACLNIASELFRVKAEYENLNRLVNTKADKIITVIDSALR